MKLTIENFQSLEGKTELEFKSGITMIIGASNSGKTAIQRALRGLILNYKGNVKKYLSHFKDKLQVDLQLKDGNPVYSWIKTAKGQTIYKIVDEEDEQEYEKAGNNDIYSFVSDFPFIVRDKQLINTYTEKEGLPFPFNLNDVELFKMFEELYNISSSAIIFKFMKKLETQTNSSIAVNKETIATNKERIEKIIDIEDKYDIEELDLLKERAEKIQVGMIGLDDDIKIAKSNNKISKAIKGVLEKRKDSEIINKQIKNISTYLEDIKSLNEAISLINNNSKIEQMNIYKKEFDMALYDSYNALYSDLKLVTSLEINLKSLLEEEKELKIEYEEVKKELAQIKTCPLCGNKLKGVHIHE